MICRELPVQIQLYPKHTHFPLMKKGAFGLTIKERVKKIYTL